MTNLRNLVDTSDEVLRGLKALGTEATNRDPWLIQILMRKLDTETKRPWSVKTAEKDFPTLKKFLEFLNVRCSSLELMTCNDSHTKVPTKSNFIAEGIPLADEDFSKPSECDIILGSDCFFSSLRNGRITGSKGQPIAQSTIFGWVVAGKIQGNYKTSFMQSHLIRVENECNADSILQQFWYTEELPLKKISFSEEEEFCENHFKATYKINNEGRFVVKLPIYRDIDQLGKTRGLTVSRSLAMGNKFKSDVEFEREYKNFMEEYKKLGHMSPNKD
ncbi:DUF1758 domain-containing protein [Trichonephila clavipes]|nr:DUF1758 domain-containing protein [Trichonephila clavipes]